MLGLIYVLIALGLTLVFSIMGVFNFAHGELYMLGGFGAYLLFAQLGIGYVVSCLLTMIGVGLIGLVLERFFFRPLAGKPLYASFMVSIGLAMVLGTTTVIVFGEDIKSVPSVFPGVVILGSTHVSVERLAVIIGSVILVVTLYLVVHHTKIGLAMRAIAQDGDAAALMGMNKDSARDFAFVFGSALAGGAGALMAPVFYVNPFIGHWAVLKAMVVIILGGIGSIPGAVVGGIVLGFVEATATTFIGTLSDVIGWVLVILLLLFKPSGLIGHER